MTKRSILIIIILSVVFGLKAQGVIASGSIRGASNQETYDYRYIAELYAAGESANLADEIKYFIAQYPESVFLPYLRYIEANLAMEQGLYPEAIAMYSELLDKPLSQDVMGVLILNYAFCLFQTREEAKALNQLQRIDNEFTEPSVVAEANKLRARIHHELGQFYSAEKYYRLAWNATPDDPELRYQLFSTRLKLNMDSEALQMIDAQALSSEYALLYASSWLQFLLNNDRYQDFDEFAVERVSPELASAPRIQELKIKRAFATGDYDQIEKLVENIAEPSDAIHYYRGLLLVQQGNPAAADSIFHLLVKQGTGEIAIAAYLERLKILFGEDQDAAIEQLDAYLNDNPPDLLLAEAYYTLGHFLYSRQDYQQALRQLGQARQFTQYPDLSAKIDILIAESWFQLEAWDMALESYNRYLNLFPEGASASTALFRIGYLQFQNKNYHESRQALQRVLFQHSASHYANDALYYLGEIEFYLANYNKALDYYHDLLERKPHLDAVMIRIAQSSYYLGNYSPAAEYAKDLSPSYDAYILKGVIYLALKDYSQALELFKEAEKIAEEPLLKREARSYMALNLFQMKQYQEASSLYRELSDNAENPDTYFFLSAKSAYAAKDYHQALELYDSFIDQYPDSQFYYLALADIANAYYNLGNYEQAVEDYLNLLVQFRNKREFTEEETAIVRSALVGIELGMRKVDNQDYINRLLMMPETFMSQFISFELNLMILKLYYDAEEWTELLDAAEELRAKYPQSKPQDLQMMMISALINLKQFSRADSLLSDAYSVTSSSEVLIKWAELQQLTGEYAAAIEKYREAYRQDKLPQTWLAMLSCSQAGGYILFEDLWALGSTSEHEMGEAMLIRLEYLYQQQRFDDAGTLADAIIAANLPAHDHAMAFLAKGLIAFSREDYPTGIALLKRVIVLFPEYPEATHPAAFHVVRAYLNLGAKTEAETLLTIYKDLLTPDEMLELDKLMGVAE
ncbi:MAG: tetratricopeptide repeat protein [Candidatus Cloacimonetes bacterium]|nr:tetratricopeptide repeat protein [Candidatus Cloacimonadota bacterium]